MTNGTIQKVNLLNATQLAPDPVMAALLAQVPGPNQINNFRVGDSQAGQLRNTAGYSYVVRNNDDQDNVTGRLDYYVDARKTP